MKTMILCLSFLFGVQSYLEAQVLAGVLGDLEYTVTSIDLQIPDNPPNNFAELTDSLDVTGDGVEDLVFQVTLASVPDFEGSVISVSSLNPDVELMTTGYDATRLVLNDPILPDSTWSAGFGWPVAAFFYGIAGLTTSGQWLNDFTGYMGFRVLMPTDTLYGWLDVYAEANLAYVKLKVSGFALEPVINGVEEQAEEGFALFPNPAGDYVVVQVPAVRGGIFIFDSMGRMVLERDYFGEIGGEVDLDISMLPAGVYRVVFMSEGVTKSPLHLHSDDFCLKELIISH
ncbi:MAG: T9SS type A sorting domain-containing protein [Lewinellaceae bacterium]|nr:T9SS type A sorting domain-containing protein [Lewinellaceae bacterium]